MPPGEEAGPGPGLAGECVCLSFGTSFTSAGYGAGEGSSPAAGSQGWKRHRLGCLGAFVERGPGRMAAAQREAAGVGTFGCWREGWTWGRAEGRVRKGYTSVVYGCQHAAQI